MATDTNNLIFPGSLQVGSYLQLKQIATPSNASSGFNRLYFKSDNNVYMLNSSGTETQVNGGGTSGPGSSTDRAIVTWNGTAGSTLRDNSTVTIASTGFLTTTKNRINIGANGNIGLSDTTMFDSRTSGSLNVGIGAGNTLNGLTSGSLNSAIGWGNMTGTVTGSNNQVVGVGCLTSLTSGSNNLVMGYVAGSSISSGTSNIIIGTNIGGGISTTSGNMVFGNGADVTSASIIGSGAIANQLVLGGPTDGGITDVVIGKGWFSTTPPNVSLTITGATSSNTAGSTFTIKGSVSTGTATGGSIVFQTSPSTTSGNVFNTWTTGLTIDGKTNVAVGTGALATSATDGFLYIPTCAGTPSGVPTSKTGLVPLIMDSTNSKLYSYIGGAWKSVTLA